MRPFLIASIVMSVVIWYSSEAFGMILTGMATDFNSGLLLVIMALAAWPKAHVLRAARRQLIQDMNRSEGSPQRV